MPIVHFYKHSTIEYNDPAKTIGQKIRRWIVRRVSPTFGHCAIEGNLYSAELTLGGCYIGCGMEAKGDYQLMVTQVRQVQTVGNECLLLRMFLGYFMPRHFSNCASFIGRMVDVDAGTPDRLFKKLSGRHE